MLSARTHTLLRLIAVTVIALAALLPSQRHKISHGAADSAQQDGPQARAAVAKR